MSLHLKNLAVGYNGTVVARAPDLDLSPDRVWLVSGPNGSGKTTLLKTMAGLLAPVSGSVAPAPQQGSQGSVFVHSTPVLFAGTVRSNLSVVTDPRRVESIAAEFELTDWLDHAISKLSHGIRQRTSLARAIATRPRVLLLDEPEGGLDARARELWLRFLRTTLDQKQMLIVYAAHRFDAMEVATEQIALTRQSHVEP